MSTLRLCLASILGLSATLGLAACESVDSNSIKTSGVYAFFTARVTSAGTAELTAELKVGGANSNTYLDLSSGDSLLASHGAVTQEMGRNEPFPDLITYTTNFSAATAGDVYTIDFHRADDVSALGSTVTIPPAFTVTIDNPVVSRAQPFVITWDPVTVGSNMSVIATGACTSIVTRSAADTGTLTIAPADWIAASGQAQATCNVTLTIERSSTGTVATAFGEGGSFTGAIQQTVTISSTP